MATEMYKISVGLVPDPVKEHFVDVGATHERETRLSLSNNFTIPIFKLEICRKSFMHRGPKLWRQVPNDLKSAPSLTAFKSRNISPS